MKAEKIAENLRTNTLAGWSICTWLCWKKRELKYKTFAKYGVTKENFLEALSKVRGQSKGYKPESGRRTYEALTKVRQRSGGNGQRGKTGSCDRKGC